MTKLFILISAFAMMGCASNSPSQEKAPTKSSKSATVQTSDESDSDSTVLKKQCPKGSKMQNGKCTIAVESDD